MAGVSAEFTGPIQMLVAAPSHGSTALKLSQLFRYAAADRRRQARIWLPDHAELPSDSPWRPLLEEGAVVRRVHPQPALLLLSDAADWQAAERLYPQARRLPRLQLLWGRDARCWGHAALQRPAIRVALGEELGRAWAADPALREPVHTLPAALDREDLPLAAPGPGAGEVLVLARSNPALGLAVQQCLRQRGVQSRCELMPWPLAQWRQALARAAVVVRMAAPAAQPGLGLRRLAAMALEIPLVCEASPADALCRDGQNALLRPSDPQALAAAALQLLDPARSALRRQLIDGGRATLVRHRRALERLQFEQLLEQHSALWQQACACHS